MKTERIVLSFIAILIGILVAGIAFYLFQATKTIPSSKTRPISAIAPTSTPKSSIFLTIESPKDEEVIDKKTVTISGKTISQAIIVISTSTADQVISPTTTGSFSATATLIDGQNQIQITAIAPNGEEVKVERTVTFSTEMF